MSRGASAKLRRQLVADLKRRKLIQSERVREAGRPPGDEAGRSSDRALLGDG
jgi:hypothetical protein